MAAFESSSRTLLSSARLNRAIGRRGYCLVLTLVIIVFSLVFLGPLYWMVTGALKSGKEIAQIPPTACPAEPNLGNYKDAWTDIELGRLLLNTIYYALGALAFQLVFQIAAAYAFSKLRPRFGNIALALMLATLMIPSTVLVIPQYVTV